MPRLLEQNPQTRFVIRGSSLLIAMLVLWWFVLQPPMLTLLRWSISFALSGPDSSEPVAVSSAGDWNFRVPLESGAGFRAVEFTIPRGDVALFTFSVPVFWAVVLAAANRRSAVRALLWGTALVSVVEVLSLLAIVEMTAYSVVSTSGGLTAWLREVANNLIVGVVPFVAPVMIAVALHRDLRSQIFRAHQPTA